MSITHLAFYRAIKAVPIKVSLKIRKEERKKVRVMVSGQSLPMKSLIISKTLKKTFKVILLICK